MIGRNDPYALNTGESQKKQTKIVTYFNSLEIITEESLPTAADRIFSEIIAKNNLHL